MEKRDYLFVLRALLIPALVALLAASPSLAGETAGKAAASPGVLDGKVFVVDTGDMGKRAKEKDTLSFRDGKFHSAGCDRYGFGDAPYTASAEGDTILFAATTYSEKKGKIEWKGTVRGDTIDVRYVWTDAPHWYKPNPKPLEKWAKGEVKMAGDRPKPGPSTSVY